MLVKYNNRYSLSYIFCTFVFCFIVFGSLTDFDNENDAGDDAGDNQEG